MSTADREWWSERREDPVLLEELRELVSSLLDVAEFTLVAERADAYQRLVHHRAHDADQMLAEGIRHLVVHWRRPLPDAIVGAERFRRILSKPHERDVDKRALVDTIELARRQLPTGSTGDLFTTAWRLATLTAKVIFTVAVATAALASAQTETTWSPPEHVVEHVIGNLDALITADEAVRRTELRLDEVLRRNGRRRVPHRRGRS